MFAVVAAHEVRSAAADAPAARGVAERRDDARMVGEPEVIVAAEGDALAPFDGDAHATRFTRFDRASAA